MATLLSKGAGAVADRQAPPPEDDNGNPPEPSGRLRGDPESVPLPTVGRSEEIGSDEF